MSKIKNDKYYTPPKLAKKLIDYTFKVIGAHNITEVIEPSAGNGSFSLQIDNCLAYDIEPEHKSIIKQDFLKLDVPYKKGRLIIGNPPFGSRNKLSEAFYNKSVSIGDYIAFIQPISQYNNNNSLYKFNLIKSIDLEPNNMNLFYTYINLGKCYEKKGMYDEAMKYLTMGTNQMSNCYCNFDLELQAQAQELIKKIKNIKK